MGCPSYFWHFWKLGPSEAIGGHGMSRLLLALWEFESLLDPDFSWDVQATFGTLGFRARVFRTFLRMPKLVLQLLGPCGWDPMAGTLWLGPLG